jgi:DNA-binding PadR family transcriptional regulator
MKYLTRKDELLLLSILKLGDNAYLVKLREYLNKNTHKKWSIGNVFVSLERLEGMGYIEPKIGKSSPKRGGKAIKYYFVTQMGFIALKETKIIHESMWEGVQEIVFNK